MADIRDMGSGITATPDEINALDGNTASASELSLLDASEVDDSRADGPWGIVPRVAKATYDISGGDDGTVGAHGLGVTLPDNARIVAAWFDVITTFTDGADDSATMAVHVEGAGDIVAAVAISAAGDPWDAGSAPDPVPDLNDGSTQVKTTQAREITVTVADDEIDAGKFVVYLLYFVGG